MQMASASAKLSRTAASSARLPLIAGVVVHLPAAGLPGREFHRLSQALEHGHHRFPRLREQGVVVACDE